MSDITKRVCIIGAGPSGMCALYQLKLLGDKGPEVMCYEKQDTWNGQWNYNWRTGTDEYGELIHGSMYRYLWTIGPKDLMEFADYSFKKHFGKRLPSYVPREIMRQYLHGRWTKSRCGDMTSLVNFKHVVSSVDYREETNDFVVWVKDLKNNTDIKEIFSHVVVANGKFTVPFYPDFPGNDTFPGRVLHSHDFRDACQFKGMDVLIIGARFSASDIAIVLHKYGAQRVFIAVKNELTGLKWPTGVEERSPLERINKNVAEFKDGTSARVDAIIVCTGYIHHHPFLRGNLSFDFKTHTSLLADHLYKGTVWTRGGNNKLFFMNGYECFLAFSIFDIQGEWIMRYIMGTIASEPVSPDAVSTNVQEWQERLKRFETPFDTLDFERDLALLWAKDTGYPEKYITELHVILTQTIKDRIKDISTYRDKSFWCAYTGEVMPTHHTKWMDALDDSVDEYL